ncbi:hypothetical protein EQK42_03335 [Streptomyces albidoflavus]|nr:hypothetical protein EQK42_03335 [Streptomyces albidoflavus]
MPRRLTNGPRALFLCHSRCWGSGAGVGSTVTRAGRWIDQRSSRPEDLTELLQASTGTDRSTENPFF